MAQAIMANQKNCEWDFTNLSDEFQSELAGFVSEKKLWLTGGVEV